MGKPALDLELMDTKEFKRAAKKVGDSEAKRIIEKTDEELKQLIASHSVSIQQVKAEMESNPNYQSASELIKGCKSAMKETADPLKAVVTLATTTLRSRKSNK